MTVLCGGGASAPLPGVAAQIVVDQAFVQSILPAGLAWLYPFLPFMRSLEIGSVATFCSTDPPAFVLPSGPDLFAFLVSGGLSGAGAIGSVDAVDAFVTAIVQNYIWYKICGCTGMATPAPPAAPPPPANLPAINPPTIVSPTPGTPCKTQLGINDFFDGRGAGAYVEAPNDVVPVGATTMYAKLLNNDTLTPPCGGAFPHSDINCTITFNYPGGAQAGAAIPIVAPRGVQLFTPIPVPDGASNFTVSCVTANGLNDCQQLINSYVFYCFGATANTGVTCCPPDPVLKGQIQAILDLVTIIQRQVVPFAYIASTAHAGLNGTGTFPVQGLLGVKVVMTSSPAAVRTLQGTPAYQLSLGWMSIETPDGVIEEKRLHATTQTWTPRCMSDATLFGYNFSPGVVATVTELLREP